MYALYVESERESEREIERYKHGIAYTKHEMQIELNFI